MAELKTVQAQQTPTPAEAMEDEWFDLLPIEVKLIKVSLGLGIGLLAIFVVIFRVLPNM